MNEVAEGQPGAGSRGGAAAAAASGLLLEAHLVDAQVLHAGRQVHVPRRVVLVFAFGQLVELAEKREHNEAHEATGELVVALCTRSTVVTVSGGYQLAELRLLPVPLIVELLLDECVPSHELVERLGGGAHVCGVQENLQDEPGELLAPVPLPPLLG